MFPVAGGTAHIPQLSHGAFTSFILSWTAWLSALTMAPIEVQAILQYASTYFSSLIYMHHGVPLLTTIGMGWATCLMLLFCILNIASYNGLMRFNTLLFIFKLSVILLTVAALIKTNYQPTHFSDLLPAVSGAAGWHGILTALATGGVAFAFTGFKHGVELAGETKKFAIAIPFAIVGSVLICLLLYLGLQIAFIGALSTSVFQLGWHNLSFVGDIGPFAGLAAGVGLIWLANLLFVDAIVSPAGAGLIYVTSTARILYAMSQIGYLPRWLTIVNKQHFPVAAIIVNFILGMLLFLPLPGWQAMVSFLVSGMVISYAMGPIALLCMRLELPNLERQFRLPAATLLCCLAFYFCNLLSYWTGWETLYKLAIAMGIGICLFAIACLRGKMRVSSFGLKTGLWIAPYLIGLISISYFGAFGGKNIIPFGWDFLVIAIFSVCILYLAVKNRGVVTNDMIISSINHLEAVA